ncbi:unnamed protein product [Lathyrus sativus]|nr:unnamed protein product [Lathyrus sativus]
MINKILPTSNLRVHTFAELKASTKNFRPDILLGEGGFGKVYRGWLGGITFAVKKLNSEVTKVSRNGSQKYIF